jgi:hypothetical protein
LLQARDRDDREGCVVIVHAEMPPTTHNQPVPRPQHHPVAGRHGVAPFAKEQIVHLDVSRAIIKHQVNPAVLNEQGEWSGVKIGLPTGVWSHIDAGIDAGSPFLRWPNGLDQEHRFGRARRLRGSGASSIPAGQWPSVWCRCDLH